MEYVQRVTLGALLLLIACGGCGQKSAPTPLADSRTSATSAGEPAPATAGAASSPAMPQSTAPTSAAAKPRFTISAATTAVTEPVAANGRIDYVAALNAKASAGVKLDDNAYIPMVAVFGCGHEDEASRKRFYQLLGVPEPSREPQSFLNFDHFARVKGGDHDALSKQVDEAKTRVWKKQEFPLVAAWLDACDADLGKINEATKRPKFYAPYVRPPATGNASATGIDMLMIQGPNLLAIRRISQALTARALLRAGEGTIDAAVDDLLAAHRLARNAGGQSALEFIVACALEILACEADVLVVNSGRLSRDHAHKLFKSLEGLPSLSGHVEAFNVVERWMALDTTLAFAFEGPKILHEIDALAKTSDGKQSDPTDSMKASPPPNVDWDAALKVVNALFDQLAMSFKKVNYFEQKADLEQVHAVLDSYKAELGNAKREVLSSLLAGKSVDPIAAGDVAGKAIAIRAMPDTVTLATAGARAATKLDLARLALAIYAYRQEKGKLPEKLGDLAPGRPERIPIDRFTGGHLQYRLAAGKAIVYALGANGRDDGGVFDLKSQRDDVAVTLTIP